MKIVTLLYALLATACCLSHEPDNSRAIIQDRTDLHGIELRDDSLFQEMYPAIKCLRVAAHGHSEAGLVCRSQSSEFLLDNGIDVQVTSGPAEANRSVTVSTANSLYEMQERALGGRTVYTAEVDCDDQNDAAYRPTSTCSITYWPLRNGEFIYANITIENHTSRQHVLSRPEIDLIISNVEE